MSLSPALADPLKQTLAAEGQPLLDEFTALIGSAVQGLLVKSPALGVGAGLFLQVAHIFAQAELNNLLAHNAHVQGSSTEPLPPLQTAVEVAPPSPTPAPEPAPEPPHEPGGQPAYVEPPPPPPAPRPGEPGGQPQPDPNPLDQPSDGPLGLKE